MFFETTTLGAVIVESSINSDNTGIIKSSFLLYYMHMSMRLMPKNVNVVNYEIIENYCKQNNCDRESRTFRFYRAA